MRKVNQFEVKYTNQLEWFQTQLQNYQIIFITRHLISHKAHNYRDKTQHQIYNRTTICMMLLYTNKNLWPVSSSNKLINAVYINYHFNIFVNMFTPMDIIMAPLMLGGAFFSTAQTISTMSML